jgi:hypothetical protein
MLSINEISIERKISYPFIVLSYSPPMLKNDAKSPNTLSSKFILAPLFLPPPKKSEKFEKGSSPY